MINRPHGHAIEVGSGEPCRYFPNQEVKHLGNKRGLSTACIAMQANRRGRPILSIKYQLKDPLSLRLPARNFPEHIVLKPLPEHSIAALVLQQVATLVESIREGVPFCCGMLFLIGEFSLVPEVLGFEGGV